MPHEDNEWVLLTLVFDACVLHQHSKRDFYVLHRLEFMMLLKEVAKEERRQNYVLGLWRIFEAIFIILEHDVGPEQHISLKLNLFKA